MSASSLAEAVPVATPAEGWSLATRVAFRFSFVDELTIDGVAQPPLLSNTTRWRRMVFDNPRMMSIQLVGDQRNRYMIDLGMTDFTLKKRDDPAWKAVFRYRRPDPRTLVVAGTMDGRQVLATMHLEAEKEFLLNTRGFHWVSEYPFNR